MTLPASTFPRSPSGIEKINDWKPLQTAYRKDQSSFHELPFDVQILMHQECSTLIPQPTVDNTDHLSQENTKAVTVVYNYFKGVQENRRQNKVYTPQDFVCLPPELQTKLVKAFQCVSKEEKAVVASKLKVPSATLIRNATFSLDQSIVYKLFLKHHPKVWNSLRSEQQTAFNEKLKMQSIRPIDL